MANESFVQVNVDGTGKKVDSFPVTQADGTSAHRQAVVIADATTAASSQTVDAGGKATTRDDAVANLLANILIELRCMNTILQATLSSRDDLDTLRETELLATLQQIQ